MSKINLTDVWAALDTFESVTASELKAVISNFVLRVQEYGREEHDLPERIRTLRFARAELASAQAVLSAGTEKNGLILAIIGGIISMLDCELEIVRMEWERPEWLGAQSSPIHKPKPTLHLLPNHRELGVMGMTELLTAMQLLGGIGSSTGKEPTTIAFADTFEQTFGFSYNDIYDRQRELFKRKFCNLTKTLDALKAALVKEYRRREAPKGDDPGGKK